MASTAHTGERAVEGITSGLINLGQEVTWRAQHFGIWQQLTSRITVFERPFHFRDSLIHGIFRRLDHDHFFSCRDNVTIMRDVFDFQSPLGILGRMADRLFLIRYLTRLLVTRNAVIRRAAETERWQRYLTNANL
jgi:ligand-binding SRPBCC domain-containing protein